MRRFLVVPLLLIAACSGNNRQENTADQEQTIVIRGTLENGAGTTVTLDRMGATAFEALDSSRCDSEGRFSFRFQASKPDFYGLKYTRAGYVTLVARPGDSLVLQGRADSLHPYSIKGSPDSELIRSLAVEHNRVLDELRQISKQTRELQGEAGYPERKLALNRQFDSITRRFAAYSEEFIRDNRESLAILIALYNQYGPGLPVFHPLTDLQVYEAVDSALYDRYPENEAVISLHNQLVTAREQMESEQNEVPGPARGDNAPDFVSTALSGQPLALTDLEERYILLHFWASWSKPSVDELPYLQEALEQFGDQSFALLMVSLDQERSEWLNAAEKIPGARHVSKLARWETPSVDLYGVERIPANFLVGPGGTILERDLFGDELLQKLENYLN